MDLVFIKQLTVETTIGAYDWEKTIKQTLLLDIEMAWDNTAPAEHDDLTKALDYATVSQRLTTWLSEQKIELIETVAERVAAILLDEFAITWLRLTVHKPDAVSNAAGVGVTIERGVKV
ncbi:dihydroneopterin aldolase [Psychrobium sp. 1_MG-2023]|uniref:dihydroneopterin aldolase n=1 Tax=Psychrobium sp. 1_MG-2023 TaxID=3062624 RepID=UPI0027361A10|nr:dihydroneopterin aldolase [Psychrobium sp. 1_MG-2023]MDP2560741.1 dihydroneopterin aldolase [Psychrobium sp. 1_MG-2023]